MIIVLLALLILLNVADSITTIIILKRGGQELNPIIKWCIDRAGIYAGVLIPKFVIISPLVIAGCTYFVGTIDTLLLLAVDLFYVFVVYHNIRQMNK